MNNFVELIDAENTNVDSQKNVNNKDDKMTVDSNKSDKAGTSNSYASVVKKDEFPKELIYIPTEITESRSEVVVFDELLVKNGSERSLFLKEFLKTFNAYNLLIMLIEDLDYML